MSVRRCFFAGALAVFSTLLLGCAHDPRFKDQPVVWRVDDAHPIAEPGENEYLKLQYFADVFAMRRLERTLELRDHEPARNTNALDEVPNSTWFQNRIGRRAVTADEVTRGAGGSPPAPPLTILGAKVGGGNAGFVVKDAAGKRFLIKFDRHENPEMQTGGDAMVVRLFWAMGYNVPSDNVFILERGQLLIDKDASFKDGLDRKHPFTQKQLEEVLATSPRRPDGTYRALSSELLPGKPKGGWLPEGVRDDDLNDLVPHEHRREVRGLRVFAAWLGHTDMKQDNTLDMYVEQDGHHFLRHYLIDFGEALGGHAAEKNRDEDGFEHMWDWENQSKAALSFGLWKRPWESRVKTPWLSVGAFSVEDFNPVTWREAYPYFPFFEAEQGDSYWAARIVMRFDRPLLEAAVAAGQFGTPEAARYLVETLFQRRRKIGMAYLETVTPLDELTLREGALCGVDLGVRFGLASSGVVVRLGPHDVLLDRVTVNEDGGFCMTIPESEDYTVYRLSTRRGLDERRAMQVHFKGGPKGRILGVIRREP
ncbi:MAG: hypothetical protein ABI193_21915 [Minicystis sp.]